MTPEKAIQLHYGVRLMPCAADGIYRAFKIDQLRNGYLLKVDDCAVFGSIIDAECIVFDGKTYRSVEINHKDRKEIRAEWLIWEIARSMLERGERLNAVNAERLALAVQRLEAWL